MQEHEARVRIVNPRAIELSLILEPWGEVHTMESGAVFQIVAHGPVGDELEVALEEDWFVIWAWPGSVVRLFDADIEQQSEVSRPRVPLEAASGNDELRPDSAPPWSRGAPAGTTRPRRAP